MKIWQCQECLNSYKIDNKEHLDLTFSGPHSKQPGTQSAAHLYFGPRADGVPATTGEFSG
jgi:hypothetical protein